MTPKESVYKKIEIIINELKKLNYDGVYRVNEFNVHSYKLYELRGFLAFYKNERDKIILKRKREEFWNSENGKKFKHDIENEINILEENHRKTTERFNNSIYNKLEIHLKSSIWNYKIFHNKVEIALIDEFGNMMNNYSFSIYYRKDFSNLSSGRLVINIDSFNDFNLITNKLRPIFINDFNEFLKDKELHEELLKTFEEWTNHHKEYINKYKILNNKLYNTYEELELHN